MRRKNVINFIEMKQKIGSILIWIMLIAMAIFAVEVYADNIVGGTERQIANEKTIVRTTTSIVKASSGNNKIEQSALVASLNRYAGISATTVTQKTSSILLVKFLKTGNEYEVDVNSGPLFEKIGIIAPYIPNGYSVVEGTNLDNGLVVQDSSGNQFVWVEVPKTSEVYPTAGLLITEFTDDDFSKIENDLLSYTIGYTVAGRAYTDTHNDATGLTSNEYYTQKKKMLKSIYKNGGFYVGRYETGIDYSQNPRTASGNPTQTPVIKQNAYPYNWVTVSQAQELSETFATEGYTSSLMFGVQYDLVLRYLQNNGSTQTELKDDSTELGNHKNSTFNITNANAKYSTDGNTWTNGAYGQKASGTGVLLSTGASGTFSKQNIYDLAGNALEWTLEFGTTSQPSVWRGRYYGVDGNQLASYRTQNSITGIAGMYGFRTALYKDEEIITSTYTITYDNNGRGTALAAQTATGGTATTLSTTTPTATGYIFKGWATSSTATTAEYAAGALYTGSENVTLYAVWEQIKYTITLNANGGKFSDGTTVKTITVNAGDKIGTVPNPNSRTGYTAKGWNTNKNATTGTNNLANLIPTSNVTYYFIWGIGGGSIM